MPSNNKFFVKFNITKQHAVYCSTIYITILKVPEYKLRYINILF